MHRSITLLLLTLLLTAVTSALPVPIDRVWTDEDGNVIAFTTTKNAENISKAENVISKAPKQLVFNAPSEQENNEELDNERLDVSFLVPLEERPRALEKFIWS